MKSNFMDKLTSNRFIGPLAIVLALLVLGVSEAGHQELSRLNDEREVSVETQLAAGRLRRILLFMETSTRGYLITGRTEYLAPYNQQAPNLESTLKTIETLALSDLKSKSVLMDLAGIARRKQSDLHEMIRLFQGGDRIGAMVSMETDVGLTMMTQISALVDQVIDLEGAKFAVAGEVRANSVRVSRLLIWVLVLSSLLGAMMLMRLGRARERDHLRHMAQLHAERDLLDEVVTRRTAETVALALHMERVREDERGRLARELHDELGGLLTAAKLDVARIRKRLPEDGPGHDLLLHLSQSLDAGIALKRRIIEDLRPSSLANLGLMTALLIQCREFSQRAEISVITDIEDISLPDDHALAVYRIVQEALTNVAKYAAATEVCVSMQAAGDQVEIRVVDDGQGFDPKTKERAGGHGLQGMRFRVRACGGDLHIQSSPEKGTSIVARLPMNSLVHKPAEDPHPGPKG